MRDVEGEACVIGEVLWPLDHEGEACVIGEVLWPLDHLNQNANAIKVYTLMSCTPISQWEVASEVMKLARMTETVRTRVAKGSKLREKGRSMAQATQTIKGMAKSAIWMDEPIATPMDRSILFLRATTIAVMCSQALPGGETRGKGGKEDQHYQN